MINRILVPLDGSELAEEVLPLVEDIAERLKAEVYFIQVVPLRSAVMMGTMVDATLVTEQMEAESKVAEEYLSRLAGGWRAKGIDAKFEVLQGVQGTPAVNIVEFAHSRDAHLIAMCTHGRSGLGRLVFGSVADQVLREAGTPVLLVKPSRRRSKTAS